MKQILLTLLLFLLSSCINRLEEDETFDIIEFYRTEPSYQYEVTAPITISDTIPQIALSGNAQWSYVTQSEYQDFYNRSAITLDTILSDSIAVFQRFGVIYSVILTGKGYRAYCLNLPTESSHWRTDTLSYLPIPHMDQLKDKYNHLCIIMDDGSVAYRIGDEVHSSRYGRISGNSTLVDYNGSDYGPIAKIYNEFIEKELVWFQ